jgi:hypothetical protein
MQVMIHAVPERMWYVRDFLLPALTGQGIPEDHVRVWLDDEGKGNLIACMESFAALEGVPGGTWHLQDDVLVSSDFAARARENDEGVVYGFCCRYFRDDPALAGTVYPPDAWHSFQCVRVPNDWAAACARWFFTDRWLEAAELLPLARAGKGDDSFFHTWLELYHGREPAVNLAPNLAEHVDWLIGGSVLHAWRDYFARSDAWAEPEAVEALREALKKR